MIETAPPANKPQAALIHGSAIVLGSKGVLIKGASGSGKTTLAHALIAECANRNLFSRWVGDDQLYATNVSNSLVVRAAPNIAGKAEQFFNTIIDVDFLPAARIDLIVHLQDPSTLERMRYEETDENFPSVPIQRGPQHQTGICVPVILSRLAMV